MGALMSCLTQRQRPQRRDESAVIGNVVNVEAPIESPFTAPRDQRRANGAGDANACVMSGGRQSQQQQTETGNRSSPTCGTPRAAALETTSMMDALDSRDMQGLASRDLTSPNILLLMNPTPESIMVQTVEELTRSIRVKTFLGAGGFAWVFQGVYQATAVAVKLALAPKNTDEARYCREAVLAQQLRHPHVVATYLARGITLSKDMVDDIYGRPSDASAADGGAASSSTATPRVPGALTMLPNFPSAKSDDGMGNPRVGQQPMSAAAQEAGGWPQALCNMGVLPDQILMVMVQELCDGGNLAGALKRGTFRPQGKTSLLAARRMLVRTAAEICRGMLHLHNANVIHGDLKPANVLLTRTRNDRRGFTAKVADFGLSKLLHDDTSHVLSDNVGTVAYSSPEAIQGKHSKTCDVWSFGILLWQLVAQDRPFSKLTPAQIMMGVGFNNLKPTWPPEVWPELCALGERCLASNPVDRPGFEELEEALVVLEEGLREESKRVSMEQRAAAAAAAAAGMASGGAAGVVPAAAGTSVAAAAAAAHTARPGAAFAT